MTAVRPIDECQMRIEGLYLLCPGLTIEPARAWRKWISDCRLQVERMSDIASMRLGEAEVVPPTHAMPWVTIYGEKSMVSLAWPVDCDSRLGSTCASAKQIDGLILLAALLVDVESRCESRDEPLSDSADLVPHLPATPGGRGVFLAVDGGFAVRPAWRATLEAAIQAITSAVGPNTQVRLSRRPSLAPVQCFYLDAVGSGGRPESIELTISISPFIDPAEVDTDINVERIRPGSDHGFGFANDVDVLCFAAYLLASLGASASLDADCAFGPIRSTR